MSMPASRSAISRPMLLITVATTAFPFSRPSRFICLRAHQHHRVAIDDVSAFVDEDRAISIAVIRDPECDIRHRRTALRELLAAPSSRSAD